MFKRFKKQESEKATDPAPGTAPTPASSDPDAVTAMSLDIPSRPGSQFRGSRTPSHYQQDSLDFIRQGDIRTRASKRFQSYRLIGEYEQPWKNDKKMSRTWINNAIVYGFFVLGLAISGYICYSQLSQLQKQEYCLIMDDGFTGSTISTDNWNHEVQVGGYGTGNFDWTTADPSNSFVTADGLHIKPTLTNATTSITDAQIASGYTLNLTADGTCTSTLDYQCAVVSNATTGAMIPPVRSARLNTKGKKAIRYGKVEVVAKMPKGDWLWPAIWLFPQDDAYGAWPRSGELDIAELRGNAGGYPSGGRDTYTTSMHWGPSPESDAYWRATAGKSIRRADFSQGYHTFGLIWSKNYLFFYLDFQLQQIQYWSFLGNQNMFQRGYFSESTTNGTLVSNPWSSSTNLNAPFDKPFFLILNVAVGGQNGWFPDGVGGKPWLDKGPTAMKDFYNAATSWLPSWGSGNENSMNVRSVKMWQEGKCGATA